MGVLVAAAAKHGASTKIAYTRRSSASTAPQ